MLVDYLKTRDGIPEDAPSGTLIGRQPGDTTVYVLHSGGRRMVRGVMDRADIWYDAYAPHRSAAADLAYRVREFLLEDLPGRTVGGAQILDVAELNSPKYLPDSMSLEDVYGGEVAVFYTEG